MEPFITWVVRHIRQRFYNTVQCCLPNHANWSVNTIVLGDSIGIIIVINETMSKDLMFLFLLCKLNVIVSCSRQEKIKVFFIGFYRSYSSQDQHQSLLSAIQQVRQHRSWSSIDHQRNGHGQELSIHIDKLDCSSAWWNLLQFCSILHFWILQR